MGKPKSKPVSEKEKERAQELADQARLNSLLGLDETDEKHGPQEFGVSDEDAYGPASPSSYPPEKQSSSAMPSTPVAGPSHSAQMDAGPAQQSDAAAGATLPPYSGPSSAAHAQALARQMGQSSKTKQRRRYPGLPDIDYRQYAPPLFTLSSDKTTLSSKAPYLSSSVAALSALIRAQATVPPKPHVHIMGKRSRNKVDFDVKLNLMPLLVAEQPHPRTNYLRCVGSTELALRGGSSKKPSLAPDVTPLVGVEGGGRDDIEAWCRLFVEDKAAVKEFVLERQVTNLDTSWLEGQIRTLVATTGYKGQVLVAFPVTHARVVIHSPDKVHKVVTALVSMVSGRSTYETVKSVWPFATHGPGEIRRQCTVQSEETWWNEWREPILQAISTKRTGWVTVEDKLEALMEGVGKGITHVDWGPDEL